MFDTMLKLVPVVRFYTIWQKDSFGRDIATANAMTTFLWELADEPGEEPAVLSETGEGMASIRRAEESLPLSEGDAGTDTLGKRLGRGK